MRHLPPIFALLAASALSTGPALAQDRVGTDQTIDRTWTAEDHHRGVRSTLLDPLDMVRAHGEGLQIDAADVLRSEAIIHAADAERVGDLVERELGLDRAEAFTPGRAIEPTVLVALFNTLLDTAVLECSDPPAEADDLGGGEALEYLDWLCKLPFVDVAACSQLPFAQWALSEGLEALETRQSWLEAHMHLDEVYQPLPQTELALDTECACGDKGCAWKMFYFNREGCYDLDDVSDPGEQACTISLCQSACAAIGAEPAKLPDFDHPPSPGCACGCPSCPADDPVFDPVSGGSDDGAGDGGGEGGEDPGDGAATAAWSCGGALDFAPPASAQPVPAAIDPGLAAQDVTAGFGGPHSAAYWDYAEARIQKLYEDMCTAMGTTCHVFDGRFGDDEGFEVIVVAEAGWVMLGEVKTTTELCFADRADAVEDLPQKIFKSPLGKCNGAPCGQGDALWIGGTIGSMCRSDVPSMNILGDMVIEAWQAGRLYFSFSYASFDWHAVFAGEEDGCGKYIFPALPVGPPTGDEAETLLPD